MKELFIYGAGGHAKVVAATAELCGYAVCGFFEDGNDHVGDLLLGKPVLPIEKVPEGASVFLAFGNNVVRLQKGIELRKRFHIPAIIHPSAQVSKYAIIGEGVFVGALANIDPDCRIGDFCIINKLSSVSHDSSVGNGTHVSVNALIAGSVGIGQCCCIGIGSRIIEKKKVGDFTTIGAGAVVINDIPDNATAVGCPARIIKCNNK